MENENGINQIEIGDYILYNIRIQNQGLIEDYLAINNKVEKNYICKIVSIKELKENISLEEKKETISIHKNLKHDNIVKLYDSKVIKNFLYIFFDFIEGKTLSKTIIIDKNYKFKEKEIFIIIEQITNVLIYLYDNKIILKDLSLKNIFIQEKKKKNEKTHILLCNLENTAFLSMSKNSDEFNNYYDKIVYKLGIIICVLLDNEFYKYYKRNINEEDLIDNYIENKIINKFEITEYLKNLIILMILLGKEQRINLKKIPEHRWFKQFYKEIKHDKSERNEKTEKSERKMKINEKSERKMKTNEKSERNERSVKVEKISKIEKREKEKNEKYIEKNEKSEKNEKKSNNEPISNKSLISKGTRITQNNQKKFKEETIFTDEEYLELYKKEKELLLGLITSFDRDDFINTLKKRKKIINNTNINYSNNGCIENISYNNHQ